MISTVASSSDVGQVMEQFQDFVSNLTIVFRQVGHIFTIASLPTSSGFSLFSRVFHRFAFNLARRYASAYSCPRQRPRA